ncbi:MAG: SpoIIE family protein phosphatase [Deltaproteobacteria bacterium]|nr:SpoIIE family protein phosphatase [Deltaproteobacteria bacterium]
MFLTIKGKIIFFVALVMVACTIVNIYFTNRDVGNAMLAAQEKSAMNILHSLDLIIKDDYHNLLSDKRTMTLLKRQQLKDAAHMIESVFKSYYSPVMQKIPRALVIRHALEWLSLAPFENIDYYIIDKNSKVLASSNKAITNETFKDLKDIKHRNISEVMCFEKLKKQGDYAAFIIDNGEEKTKSVLAYFQPLDQWEYTIATSIEISNIEAEAKAKLKKITDSLIEFSSQLNITKNGFVYMFDSKGTILIPPPEHIKNDIHLSLNLMTGNSIYDDIKASSESKISELRYVSSNDDAKQPMIVYCNYFKPLKWYTSVIVPVNEINQPARKLVIRQSLIIGLMFLAGLIAVFILVTRIATPLNLLSSYAKELPELDFTKPLAKNTPIDDLPLKYRDEVGELASSFILMRQELSKNIQELIQITASRQRIESELSIAREIQLGMVPKTFPSFPEHKEFDLYATLMPAKEIGGDLYDFFLMDEEHLCFTLGDVSDKGIPSALLMVVTRTLIRTLSEKVSSPCEMMYSINNILSADNPRSMFVTLIIGILNIKTGEIKYANGGHNPPVVIPGDGDVFFKKGTNEPLVGAMPDMLYSDHSLILSPKEGFFLYTDGVNEAMNPKGEQYSNEKLLSQIEKNRDKSVNEIVKTMLGSIKEHSGAAPQSDDIAMLMIKYNGKES